MKAQLEKIRQFLQGRKTYFSAIAIALAAICGWWFGALDNTQAVALLASAGVAAGLGAKSQRTADAILTVLADLRQAQAKSAAGQKVDPKQLAADVAKQLFDEVMSVKGSSSAAALSSAVVTAVATENVAK